MLVGYPRSVIRSNSLFECCTWGNVGVVEKKPEDLSRFLEVYHFLSLISLSVRPFFLLKPFLCFL